MSLRDDAGNELPPVESSLFHLLAQRGHEHVSFFHYPEVGLKAIVGIHSTALGPSMGGCRMRPYNSESDALDDVLRLSEAMTYKNALAGLSLGGGKAVIIADSSHLLKKKKLFEKFAHCLNDLHGRYITAEDMGTKEDDIELMRSITPHVAGFPRAQGGSGDPSPWTALGVYHGIKAASEFKFGTSSLSGKKIHVQGVGSVGERLVHHLCAEHALVIVSDTHTKNLAKVSSLPGVRVHEHHGHFKDIDCDIYSPCAIGQTVSSTTVPFMRCKIIAGAANNQLCSSAVYKVLKARHILYVPDFVLNAGGVISIGGEYRQGGWNHSYVESKVIEIKDTVGKVLKLAQESGRFTERVALEMAKEIVKNASYSMTS